MSVFDGFGSARSAAALTIVVGAISLLVGIAAFSWPGITATTVAIVFGIAVLIIGATTLFTGTVAPGGSGRVAGIVLGVVGVVAGLLILRTPETTLLFIVLAGGTWLIVAGTVDVVLGIANEVPGRGLWIDAGGADILLGLLIFAVPTIGVAALAVLVSLALAVRGGVLVGTGAATLRAAHALDRDASRFVSGEIPHSGRCPPHSALEEMFR